MMVGMDKITDSVTLGSSVTGIPQSLDEQLGWMEQSRMNPLEVDNWRRIHPSLGNVKTSLQRDRIIKQLEWARNYFTRKYSSEESYDHERAQINDAISKIYPVY